MVCIAAFIILALVGIFIAFLSIFNRNLGKKYWNTMKKAWHCVFKKVRLQKCDTNFKEDVKATLLKKVILKHPKWVKPLGIIIEIASVLIVLITIWSIVIAIKSLLALWVFGTCNVSQPSQCGLGAEACSIDQGEPTSLIESIGRGFGEWGQIFSAIPDRMKTWVAADYVSSVPIIEYAENPGSLALDVVDPGCSVCMQSYKNQHNSDFIKNHDIAYLYYPIPSPDGGYKFKNSGTIVRYLYAPYFYNQNTDVALKIVQRIFTEENAEGVNWQSVFNNEYDEQQATQTLQSWYTELGGYTAEQVAEIVEKYVNSEQVTSLMTEISNIVTNEIHAKGIPTTLYDGKKLSGLFKH